MLRCYENLDYDSLSSRVEIRLGQIFASEFRSNQTQYYLGFANPELASLSLEGKNCCYTPEKLMMGTI